MRFRDSSSSGATKLTVRSDAPNGNLSRDVDQDGIIDLVADADRGMGEIDACLVG